jgi:hypothetical protein
MQTSPWQPWLLCAEHHILMLNLCAFPRPSPSQDQINSLFFLPIIVQPEPNTARPFHPHLYSYKAASNRDDL